MNIQIKPTRFQLPSNTLVHCLQKHAGKFPDKSAFIIFQPGNQKETKISYSELDRRARKIAATLQSFTNPQEKALLLFPPGYDLITALFGCLYAGVIAVPVCPPDMQHLDRDLPYLKSIISDAQASVILTDSKLFPLSGYYFLLTSENGSIQWLTIDKIGQASEYDFRPFELLDQTYAILEYFPGFSNSPKSLLHTFGEITTNLAAYSSALGLKDGAINLSCLPPYHGIGLVEGVLQSVYNGFETILIATKLIRNDPLLWIRLISEYKVNISGGPGYLFDQCAALISSSDNPNLRLENWSTAYIGSNRLSSETISNFIKAFGGNGFRKEAFIPYYEIQGTSLFLSGGRITGEKNVGRLPKKLFNKDRYEISDDLEMDDIVGFKLDQIQHPVYIIDPTSKQPLKSTEVGEVVVYYPSHQTAMKKPQDGNPYGMRVKIPGFSQQNFLRSGDLGFIDQGYLFILGNMNEGLKVDNRFYFPEDIERKLAKTFPQLRQGNRALFCITRQEKDEFILLWEIDEHSLDQSPDLRLIQRENLTINIHKLVQNKYGIIFNSIQLLPPNSIPIMCGHKNLELIKEHYLSGNLLNKVI